MNCKQNLFNTISKFSIGFVITAFLMFGIYSVANHQSSKNRTSYDESLRRIQSKEIKELVLKNDEAKLRLKSGNELLVALQENEEGLLKDVRDYNNTNHRENIVISFLPADSNPLACLFQILFILFIISPPLIVLMLILIWKELRERNKMK